MTITPVQFDPSPLYDNQVDGFMSYVTNEPFLAAAKGFTPVTLVFADNGLPLTAETFTVRQDTIDNEREMLKAFLYAEIKGWTDSIADPEGTAKLSATKYGADLGLDKESEAQQAKAQNELIVDPRHQGQRHLHVDRGDAVRDRRGHRAHRLRHHRRGAVRPLAAQRGLRRAPGTDHRLIARGGAVRERSRATPP